MTRFWALVDNSRKPRRNRTHQLSLWWKLYSALFILLAAAGLAYSIYSGAIGPFSLLAFVPAFLLFVAFFSASSRIAREWRGQTISWWLTVPCSRLELLSAKMLGAMIHLIKIAGSSIVVLALLAIGGILFRPDIWTVPAINAAAIMFLELYLLTIIISPLAMALGMLFAVIIRSRLKPLSPFIIAFVVSAVIAGQNYLLPIFGQVDESAQLPIVAEIPVFALSPMTIVLKVVLILLMAAAIFGLSTYLLAEQTEI